MKNILLTFSTLCLLLQLFVPSKVKGQDGEARLLRFPAIHDNQVVFSYAGNLYTVDANGGLARKLTSHPGYEMFARFSPDGKNIAFSGQYDGNTEVYVMPSQGGVPKRVTYTATLGRDDVAERMGPNNIVMTWKDNEHIVYRSRCQSFNPFIGQLYVANINGGLSEQLPLPTGGWCSFSPDGKQMAYNRIFREFRARKYYHAGMADDIWIYDFDTKKVADITNDTAQDIEPMWAGNKIYFLSDLEHTMNLFAYDVTTKQIRQVTNYNDYGIKFASLGNNAIVWERAGYLWKMDLATEQVTQIHVQIIDDDIFSRSELIDASKYIESYDLAPDGNRLAIIGRGDIWTIPAKTGVIRDLDKTSDIHERSAHWSPDGKTIAYISDASGEDEIYTVAQDGEGKPTRITDNGDNYKFDLKWSPDGKKILWSDRKLRLVCVDVDTKKQTLVDSSNLGEFFDYNWSPDSKWIVYSHPEFYSQQKIILYNLASKSKTEVTDGWYTSFNPTFSRDGKYLLFVSNRDYTPTFSDADFNAGYINMAKVYMITLSKETPSPFAPKDDEVNMKADTGTASANAIAALVKQASAPVKPLANMKVDLDGIAQRLVAMPVEASNYGTLYANGNDIYYVKKGHFDKDASLMYYSLKDKKETVLGLFDDFQVSADGKKMAVAKMVAKDKTYAIIDMPLAPIKDQKNVDLSGMKVMVDHHQEWQQMYDESWRQMRDFFFSPVMNGADWKGMHDRYEPLVKYVNTRQDLTYLISEMIGELSSGHTYVGDGDIPEVKKIPMGLLGAQLTKDAATGYYQIKKILKGANWDPSLRSPLTELGLNVKQGDYIIAVNGAPTNAMVDIYASLVNMADKQVELTINGKASAEGSRKIIVVPIADEANLYYYNWVQHNIAYVDSVSHGKVGYIYIPDMGEAGLNQFFKLFYPQINKKALIIDDRGNGGGFVSPLVTDRLARQLVFFEMSRNTIGIPSPEMNIGPKVLLINQYSASDGDIFPYRFRKNKLGTIIGKRSWGGVVGINATLPFLDGSYLEKPEFGPYSLEGTWVIEGHGVDPDIDLENDPARQYEGIDDQLNKAIDVIMENLKTQGMDVPPVPPYPNRVGGH
ncbi:MAG: PDZ domain-containing protein [Bacteroidia bacterium]